MTEAEWRTIGEKFYATGEKTLSEIAELTGFSVSTACVRFKELGIPKGKKEIDWSYVGNKYYSTQKKTILEIARMLKVAPETVSKNFRELGIEKEDKYDWNDIGNELYLQKGLNFREISEKVGVSASTVSRRLNKYGFVPLPIDWVEVGEDLYVRKQMSFREIAAILGVDEVTVSRNISKSGVKRHDIDWYKLGMDEYLSGSMNQREISEMLGVCRSTVGYHFKRLGIEKEEIVFDWCEIGDKYYVDGQKNQKEIAEMLGVSENIVRYNFSKNGVKRDWGSTVQREFSNLGYELLEEEYIDSKTKMRYRCSKGHINTTTLANFRKERGCPECSAQLVSGFFNETLAERNKSDWMQKICYIYKVKLCSGKEEFYKIGISINPDNRFEEFATHYNVETIELIETNLYDAVYLEAELHEQHEEYRYIPDVKFGGYTECFTRLI